MKAGGRYRVPFEQSVAVCLTGIAIGREALVFGMQMILREHHLEGLRQ
jgi:hypothetical protein